MTLYIYAEDESLRKMMQDHLCSKHRHTDSGFDLLSPEYEITGHLGNEMKLGVVCAALTESGAPAPYLLLARSSMSLTPLRMSNQIGLADAGYRGELIARVDMFGTSSYTIEKGRRLFQIVQHNWLPWKSIVIVDHLDALPAAPDNRGAGGFGSTGR
jgi:dUTP pyrophosphatase